jgi:hypothetical protein
MSLFVARSADDGRCRISAAAKCGRAARIIDPSRLPHKRHPVRCSSRSQYQR